MNTPTLNTRRLILRKFNENDLEAFYDIFSDKEVNQFLPWFPLKILDILSLKINCHIKFSAKPR